jgi:hypothetical protein
VISYFSGGVDGTYTALRQREQIDQAVLLRGIDMQLENTELWTAARAATHRLATHLQLPLLTVASNIRFMGHHYGLKWASHYQGAGLAAIGHLLGAREVLIAATSSLADLTPYGSHPLTDPLWSSATTRFVHEGAVPRTEKIRLISADPVVMDVLRVCWQDAGYNCGRCGKCLRTRLALHLLGVASPTFPGTLDWGAVDRIRLGDPSEWAFFRALEQLGCRRPRAGRAGEHGFLGSACNPGRDAQSCGCSPTGGHPCRHRTAREETKQTSNGRGGCEGSRTGRVARCPRATRCT